jgi:hypothetical protein
MPLDEQERQKIALHALLSAGNIAMAAWSERQTEQP